ncbi:serine/threonine-protein kinase CBK1-like isoform X1 [Hibiscus syriacus]|uniref:Serine/threonine-protein kinase CBK1-like isoform X1 n=1 Tax=Hibiscus syriacus TaxID=106335 RepID=A0A6A2X3V0_HIBSY|nr:serine/threonine-protein kinase CBK1-like isoform X1 [Hibiscus syriacus]
MEISSFTFLGPGDYCYNISSSWFQELDNGFNKKPGDDEDSRGGYEEAKQEEAQWITESQHQKVLFESNHKGKFEAINEYYNHLQVDQLDYSTVNRSRKSASTLAMASTVAADDNDNENENVKVGEHLRLVSKRSRLGISTCHKLVLESIIGIPNIGGSLYTTHVLIMAPKENMGAHFNQRDTERNQKTCYSITVQGVVDQKEVFTNVCIGWPGSMADEKVLEKSALFQRANKGDLRDVWIVGNFGYLLMDWVLVKLHELSMLLGACCVLYNICEMNNEDMNPRLQFELFDDEVALENNLRATNAVHAGDYIAHNLLHHELGGTSFL